MHQFFSLANRSASALLAHQPRMTTPRPTNLQMQRHHLSLHNSLLGPH
uniref:Uncharacterized protein n=1 Tax=Arundo donax TaxID=35708 RepID=A0A0A9E2V0_ARUDO